MYWTSIGTLKMLTPLPRTARISTPSNEPATVPTPPVSAAPPITTAAMTYSSIPSAALGSPLPPWANNKTPAQPVTKPARV